MKKYIWSLMAILLTTQTMAQREETYTVISPNQRIILQVDVGEDIRYNVQLEEQMLIDPSMIAMDLGDNGILGEKPRVRNASTRTVDDIIEPVYWQSNQIRNYFNELQLDFRDRFSLIFRVYNEGIAWRFVLNQKDETVFVQDEHAQFNFSDDFQTYIAHPSPAGFQHSYETFYNYRSLSDVSPDTLGMLPVLIEAEENAKMVIMEADLMDYPGFHVQRSADYLTMLEAQFPKYPDETAPGGHRDLNMLVQSRKDYIAEISGQRSMPWRVVAISDSDTDLLSNDLVFKLSSAPEGDFSWVKPGMVAWDWWNAINLKGVDFESGVNTESYKYFIDFAAENGIEYVNIDEGWSPVFDLTTLTEDIDMEEVFAYAKEKDVDLFVWCVGRTLDAQLEEAMDQFVEWGVKGLKVDFMDRDDQMMINFYTRMAEEAAKRKIHLNFHGAFKPAGLNRTYPNVLNQEAVRGLEYNKFARPDGTTPEHAVTIPFIRMVAGPMDYTPGAMVNKNKEDFNVSFDRPMSQGTRCQQLAMYVVYFAPLQMMADAPTAYEAEPEVLDFLANVPTTWDEIRAVSGKVAEHVVVARRKGSNWYVGGMTDWEARDVSVDFTFLEAGDYEATIFRDGVNAHRLGEDFILETKTVNNATSMDFHMAPGGGFAIKLTPKE